MSVHHPVVAISIDRPKNPKDLIGRTMWLHHKRGVRDLARIGYPLGTPLVVSAVFDGVRVVRSPDGREHPVKPTSLSLVCPEDQIAGEAERRAKTR